MKKVTATEFAKNFGRYREEVQRAPLAVTNHGRTAGYFVSEQDFLELKAGGRRVWRVADMSEEMIEAIAKARVPSKKKQRAALAGKA